MTEKSLPGWKARALADPHLSDKKYHLLVLGPRNLGEAFILQAIKWKYQTRGID